MSRHTDATVIPFMTHRTCTDPSCDRLCGRSHPGLPAVSADDEGDAA